MSLFSKFNYFLLGILFLASNVYCMEDPNGNKHWPKPSRQLRQSYRKATEINKNELEGLITKTENSNENKHLSTDSRNSHEVTKNWSLQPINSRDLRKSYRKVTCNGTTPLDLKEPVVEWKDYATNSPRGTKTITNPLLANHTRNSLEKVNEIIVKPFLSKDEIKPLDTEELKPILTRHLSGSDISINSLKEEEKPQYRRSRSEGKLSMEEIRKQVKAKRRQADDHANAIFSAIRETRQNIFKIIKNHENPDQLIEKCNELYALTNSLDIYNDEDGDSLLYCVLKQLQKDKHSIINHSKQNMLLFKALLENFKDKLNFYANLNISENINQQNELPSKSPLLKYALDNDMDNVFSLLSFTIEGKLYANDSSSSFKNNKKKNGNSNSTNFPPLHDAVSKNELSKVEDLLNDPSILGDSKKMYNLLTQKADGQTPAELARKKLKILRLLLESAYKAQAPDQKCPLCKKSFDFNTEPGIESQSSNVFSYKCMHVMCKSCIVANTGYGNKCPLCKPRPKGESNEK